MPPILEEVWGKITVSEITRDIGINKTIYVAWVKKRFVLYYGQLSISSFFSFDGKKCGKENSWEIFESQDVNTLLTADQ